MITIYQITKLLKKSALQVCLTLLILQGAFSQTYNWNNVTILAGGFVPAIIYSPVTPNLIYARTDIGGCYRWSSSQNKWIPLNDMVTSFNYYGGESIAPDPIDSNVVYMAAGMYLGSGNGVMLRSANQGTTWTTNTIGIPMGGNQNGRGMGERLAIDPNNTQVLYFGSRNNGLYKSTNAATSWSQVTSFPTLGDNGYGLSFVTFDKTSGTSGNGSKTIYVGVAGSTSTNSNLYKSTDAGVTWNLVAGGPTALMPSHGILGSDGNLWLSYTNDYGPGTQTTLSGQIWKYNTSSGVWTNVTPTANWGGTAGGLSVSAQNPQNVVISTLDYYAPDRLLSTSNGGTSWNVVAQPPVSWWSTGVSTYNANGANYQTANGTALIGTGATNWVQAIAINPFNANNVLYGTGAGIWASTNVQSAAANGNGAGVTWNFQDQGLEETACVGMVPTTKGAFFSQLGDIRGTRSSNLAQSGIAFTLGGNNTNGLDFAESDSAIVALVTSGTPVAAYSTDNGQTWTACSGTPSGSSSQDIAVSASGTTFVYAPSNAVASYSTNNGAAWTTCGGSIPSGARVASDRVNASKFYAVSGGTVYTSTNGGQTFTQTATGIGNGLPRPVFGIEGEFWVASGGALYKVTGSGTTVAKISNVTACNSVGFGKAAPGQTHPAIFILGTVGGVYGFYRSDDNATTWNLINDSQHQYSTANYCGGDEYIYGRMYVGTNGRGIVYGDIQTTTAPTATITPATTTTFCTGGSVVLSANTGTGYTYQWSKGGTAISGSTAASYTATASGSYTVTVTSGGLSTTSTATVVTVNALPAVPTVTTPVTYCQNATATALTATGTALKWYTVATGGTALTATPIPVTTATGTTSYYVSQTVTGCEGPRAAIAVTVNALPSAPTVTTPVTYCQNATASVLTATGTSLLWYSVATGGTSSSTAPTPVTTATGSISYYVSQTVTGCEGPRASIAVIVNALPAAPIVTTPVTYCQNATATALIATGTALKWYTVATGGTSSTTAPIPVTTTTGTTNYYVSQTTNGCEGPRAAIAVTVNALPTAQAVTTPVTYCQNATATALTATGTNLLWYTAATGGTSSTTPPTPITTATGTTNYYVSQTVTGCEGPRATIAVTVNALPTAPTVTTPVTYCQNAAATVLSATGTALKWYTVATGGISSTTVPTPSTAATGTTNYYVSQTVTGCEGPRASIAVTVNPLPTAPTVTTPVTYCQNASSNTLTATGTSLLWYTVATGGTGSATAPTPVTTAIGTTNYYVSQTLTGCEGPRASIAVTVNALPAAPTVSSPVTYCQNATASALTATGTALKWYTVATGGTSSSTAPTPVTTTIGSTGYYVSQTTNGCEGPRASIVVTINATPSAPAVISPVAYCQNSTATALTATGTNLLWYTVSTGGASSSTAPTPITTSVGTTSYYVTQTVNGCESPRAAITVTVNTSLTAPTVTSPVTYCQNATATSLTANGIGLTWYTTATGGSGSTSAPVPSTATTGSTNYYVTQTSGTCESPRSLITVIINALPVPVITSGSNMPMCTGSSTVLSTATASTYSWMNGTSQVGTSQTYTATTAGSYTVAVTNGSGCSGTSGVLVVSISSQNCYDCANVLNGTAVIDNCGVCTGGTTGLIACTTTGTIGGSLSTTSIVVYPQPFENNTKVELKNGGNIESISIYSLTGSLVYSKSDIASTEIELGENLADGLYTVIVTTQGSTYTTKIVKIK